VKLQGETIRQLLEALQQKYPAMSGQVLTNEGALHRFVNIYLNDDDVRYLGQLDTPVGPDDVVSIIPAVAGGAL
jgi:molybdopterin converting factor small subunit